MAVAIRDTDGRLWWPTELAVAQLGVSRKTINQWVRRSALAGHRAGADPGSCPRCVSAPQGWPHLDPPVRVGRVAAYDAQQLLAVEEYTHGAPRGGARRAP